MTPGVWFHNCIEGVDIAGIEFEGHTPSDGAGLNPGSTRFEPLINGWTVVGYVISAKLSGESDGDGLNDICRKGNDDQEEVWQHAVGRFFEEGPSRLLSAD